MYSLATNRGPITADEIIAKLDPAHALHRAHIADIRRLQARGARYSFEDTDVLGAALQLAMSGRTEAASYEAGWVASMNIEAPRA